MIFNMFTRTIKSAATTPAYTIPLTMYAIFGILCWTVIFASRCLFDNSAALAQNGLGYIQYSNPAPYHILIFALATVGIFPGQITHFNPTATYWLRAQFFLGPAHFLPQPKFLVSQDGPSTGSWYPYVAASAFLLGYWIFLGGLNGWILLAKHCDAVIEAVAATFELEVDSMPIALNGEVTDFDDINSVIATCDSVNGLESVVEQEELEDPFVSMPGTPSSTCSLLPSLFSSPPDSPASSWRSSSPSCDHDYLEAINNDLTIDNEQLHAALAEAQDQAEASFDCIQGLENGNMALMEENAALAAERFDTSVKFAQATDEAKMLKCQRDSAHTSLVQQAGEIFNLQHRLLMSSANGRTADARIVQLLEELKLLREHSSTAISDLQAQLAKRNWALDRASFTVSDLEDQLTRAWSACKSATATNLALESQLAASVAQVAQSVTESRQAALTISRLEGQLAESVTDSRQAAWTISSLEGQLAESVTDSRQAALTISSLESQLAKSVSAADQATSEICGLQHQLAKSQSALGRASSSITELKSQLTDAQVASELASSSIRDLERRLSVSASAANLTAHTIADLNVQLKDSKATVTAAESSLRRRCAQLEDTLNQVQAEAQRMIEVRDVEGERLVNLTTRLEAESEHQRTTISSLSNAERSVSSRLLAAQKEVEDLKRKIEEMHAVEAGNEMERREKEKDMQLLQQAFDHMRASTALRAPAFDQVNAQYEAKVAECVHLQRIIGDLQEAAARASSAQASATSSQSTNDQQTRELADLKSQLRKAQEALKAKNTEKSDGQSQYAQDGTAILKKNLASYERGSELIVFFSDERLLPHQILQELLQDKAEQYLNPTFNTSALKALCTSLDKAFKMQKLKTHCDKFPQPMRPTITAISYVIEAAREILLADLNLRLSTSQAGPAYQKAIINCFSQDHQNCSSEHLLYARQNFDTAALSRYQSACQSWLSIMDKRGYNPSDFLSAYLPYGPIMTAQDLAGYKQNWASMFR